LVFKGGRETGKGTFLRALKHLFGQHGLQITNPSHLTGRFNKHLRDCSLLFADEAIVPGDKTSESVLKGLITEPELMIEGKGIDVIQARNRLHIVMASNDQWVAPAGVDERRFAIFNVSASRKGDKPYFASIKAEMKNGGFEAMLHDLLVMDLAGWHPRQGVPQNEALNDQKARTLRGFEKAFFEMLETGTIPAQVADIADFDGTPRIATTVVQAYAAKRYPRDNITLTEVGRMFRKLGFEKCERRRPRGFILPPLAEVRAKWSSTYFAVQWDDCDSWELLQCDAEGKVTGAAAYTEDRPRLVRTR
jgi:phage/plasmid-associated DNA primase